MTLDERLSEYVRAGFTRLRVKTSEPDDALAEVVGLYRHEGWSLATWEGLSVIGGEIPITTGLAAIRSLAAMASPEGTSLLVLHNFHRFPGSAEVVQALDSRIAPGKIDRTFVVVLTPVVQVTVELEKVFAVIDHDLPGRDQLGAFARGALGVQIGGAQEVGPHCSASGWRDLRRPGRVGSAESVLLASAEAGPTQEDWGTQTHSTRICSGGKVRSAKPSGEGLGGRR